MSKVPTNVSWSAHNYCYHGICPYCGKWTTFHHAWREDEYARNVPCKNCGATLNVRPWLKIK